MQELDVQPLIDAGLFPSLVSVLYCLIISSISPSEHAISCSSGHPPSDNAVHSSRTSAVETKSLKSAGSSPAVSDNVILSPGLEAAEPVSVNEKPPVDSHEKQSIEEVGSFGVLEEPKLTVEDENVPSDLAEGVPLHEHLESKESDISVSVIDEVSMEEKRAQVYN